MTVSSLARDDEATSLAHLDEEGDGLVTSVTDSVVLE